MACATIQAVRAIEQLLEAGTGLEASMAALRSSYELDEGLLNQLDVTFVRVPAPLLERAASLRYPVMHVYCERMEKARTEQFRTFSGTLRMVIEVLISQDRLEGISERLHFYVDAVRDVIERNSGCLGSGLYMDGTYDVQFDAVEKGGRNFLQTARVACAVILNR